MRRRIRFLLALSLLALNFVSVKGIDARPVGAPGEPEKSASRWKGHPFVFVFTTDDGTACNLGWSETGRDMDFRFTIGVNPWSKYYPSERRLTPEGMHQLHADGFEIAQHTYSHCQVGVPTNCPMPPRGSLLAYTQCENFDPYTASVLFQAEIERDSVAAVAEVPVYDVRTLTYPRHMYSRAIIDSLIGEGYIGARYAENSSYFGYGNYEFTAPARNSWDDGISLFRIPLMHYGATFFGNHSADPPEHFTYEEFLAATQPYIDQAVADGGMFVIYAHHFGDDDETFGNINYGSGGITQQDLAWMVDLVRANGGVVMTLGEAVEYYRARTTMFEIDGDYVWVPEATGVSESDFAPQAGLTVSPNPFNPRTTIRFDVARECRVRLDIYNARGRLVTTLVDDTLLPGTHTVPWSGSDDRGGCVSSGVYFGRLQLGTEVRTRRMTLLK